MFKKNNSFLGVFLLSMFAHIYTMDFNYNQRGVYTKFLITKLITKNDIFFDSGTLDFPNLRFIGQGKVVLNEIYFTGIYSYLFQEINYGKYILRDCDKHTYDMSIIEDTDSNNFIVEYYTNKYGIVRKKVLPCSEYKCTNGELQKKCYS